MNLLPRLAVLAAALAACAAFAAPPAPLYAIVAVPQSTDARVDHATAVAINDAGEMAGTAYVKTKAGFDSYPARWAADGSVTVDFRHVGFEGVAIDKGGDVTTTFFDTVGGIGGSMSALWRKGARTLAPQQQATLASGMNDHGQYIGETYFDPDGIFATIYSAGVPTRLPALYDSTYSLGYGLNDAGDAVGGSMDDNQKWHAFYYHGGVLTDLLGTSNQGLAEAVNDAGQIAGVIYVNSAERAFRWENGVLTRLGETDSYIDDVHINRHGEVIWSFLGHKGGAYVAPGKTAYEVNLQLVPDSFAAWFVTEVSGLNDDGTIVAQAKARSGSRKPQSVLLVPQ